MAYRELVPHPALRPFVDRLWARQGEGQAEVVRVLPDGCIDLLVAGGRCFVVGAMTRALIHREARDGWCVAVRFRPGGAVPFLRVMAEELTDRRVDGADLGLRWLEAPALGEAAGPWQAVERLERALLARLPEVRPPEPLVDHAVRALLAAAPPSIDQLARRIGWSRQHLARAFRAHVGVGPKELGKVARLQRAVAGVQRGQLTLAGAAARAGYFDEAHMDRDFRQLVGVTPRAVRSAAGSIRPIPSLFGVAMSGHEEDHRQPDRGQHRGRAALLG